MFSQLFQQLNHLVNSYFVSYSIISTPKIDLLLRIKDCVNDTLFFYLKSILRESGYVFDQSDGGPML